MRKMMRVFKMTILEVIDMNNGHYSSQDLIV